MRTLGISVKDLIVTAFMVGSAYATFVSVRRQLNGMGRIIRRLRAEIIVLLPDTPDRADRIRRLCE